MPFSQDTNQKRISSRTNKGVPPARFEDFKKMPVDRSPPPSAPPTPPPPPTAATSAADYRSQATVTQGKPPQQSTSSALKVPSNTTKTNDAEPEKQKNEMEALAREFNKKIDSMRNEFSRQMHAMQALIASSIHQPLQPPLQQSQTLQQPYQPPLQSQPLQQGQPLQQNQTLQQLQPRQPSPLIQPVQQSQSLQSPLQQSQPIQQPLQQSQKLQQPLQQSQPLQQPSQQNQPTLQPLQQNQPMQQPLQSQNMQQIQQSHLLQPSQSFQPLFDSQQTSQPQALAQHMPHAQPMLQLSQHAQHEPQLQAAQPMQHATQWQTCQAMQQQPLFRRFMQSGDRQSPMFSSNESHPTIAHRQKKIYPLPIFSGLPEEWQTFAEAFESTTLEFEYSNLHNIMRLRDALRGRARETVESLLASSTNVLDIMQTLEETFGRPEQLIKSQIEKVRSIQPLVEGDLDSLVNFANKMSNMATFLKNARGEHHLSNPTLLSELVAKLPTPRQMQWAEKCIQLEQPPTILDFSLWLNSLRRLANMVSDSLPSSSIAPYTGATASRKFAQNKNVGNNRRFACVSVAQQKCPICGGECNVISDCSKFLALQVDDRWEKIKTLRTCFSCLKKGHRALQCFSRKKCGLEGCPQFHHRLLHGGQRHAKTALSDQQQTSSIPTEPAPSRATTTPSTRTDSQQKPRNCHADCHHNGNILFQILPVKVYGANGVINTYAFVDDGANVTMIDQELARQLGLRGSPKTLEIQWLNEQTSKQQTEIFNVEISGVSENAKIFKMSDVHMCAGLALPTQTILRGEFPLSQYNHISGLPLHDYECIQPKLIISLAHAFLTVPIEVPRAPVSSGPIAINTRLGWILYGPVPAQKNPKVSHVLHMREVESNSTLEEINRMMKDYFDVENFGVKASTKPIGSKYEERALNILKETTKRIGSRYESGLLWKEDFSVFPDSFQMALNRLSTVERKMARDVTYSEEYCAKIDDYINKGYARKLSSKEAQLRTEKTFYLPHFGVRNPNKTGLRLVFDAAAEVNNMSLNKSLLPGPDINQPLISILFKFREAPVAVCGDIKEMFHQVLIAKNDQDSQRFLWRGGDPTIPPQTYVMERLIFGATCSPTIAQYVKNINAQRYAEVYPRAVKGIIERHYVDDYVDCFQTEEEAVSVVKKVLKIHEEGGFCMRNILSNSDVLKKAVGSSACDSGEFSIDQRVDRVLGINWMSKTDVFIYILKFSKVDEKILNFKRVPTKREVLSLNMSMFDPFGFLANYIVSAKILMQAIWKSGIQWDDPINAALYSRWKMWMEELPKVEQFKVPRCYFLAFQTEAVDLHVFVDASEEAMAAVAYWRAVSDGFVKIIFISGKSSCAPTRYHTIPKLELQAAVLGARLKESIVKCHTIKINRTFFWSDSHTVIRWIRSDHRTYKQYVANRVSEILEISNMDDWRWCPGELNPADEATRAKFPPRYNAENKWKNGPAFLEKDENEWPDESKMQLKIDSSNEELRSKHFMLLAQQVCSSIPDINRFSNYSRFKRSTAWMLRFINNLKQKIHNKPIDGGELSAQEELMAEIYLCKWAQSQKFAQDLANLKKSSCVEKDSPLKTLNPRVGPDDLLRVGGRIERATCVSIETIHPIILPKDHAFTRLLVEYYHKKCHHINISTVISEIRLRFWIPSIRQVVNSVKAHCLTCKIRSAKPRQPMMGVLPLDRVTPFIRPFSYTGLDFFGPISVTIRRQKEKRWVALFTCLTIRAVHLEIAADLSSDACLMCIRNFINRRGVPVQIRSDNGTNFVGIAKELQGIRDFFDHDVIMQGLSPLGVKWIFNTPLNPSEGGAWERLVQSVKKGLFIMLKEHAPRLETLQSFLIETENMVNSRPLTHLPVTPEEPGVLTPNHFLLGCANATQTPAPFEPKLTYLRKQWRILRNLKNGMWQQWIREYLPELTRRSKWFLPSKPISVGCLVLICDTVSSPSQWKRGRVQRLYLGKDGVARSADVQTQSGVLKRPVSKLAILDVEHSKEKEGESPPLGSIHGGGDVVNAVPTDEENERQIT